MSPVLAYIGLGSNLDAPVAQLRQAIQALAELPGCSLQTVSSLYGTPPMGPQDQPDYVNAVARLETTLPPEALLDALQAIENAQGRVRERRWGARTLDLDILLYGDRQIRNERLTVPHPGLFQRNFVLYPLQEIEPGLVFPDGQILEEVIAGCSAEGLQRLDKP